MAAETRDCMRRELPEAEEAKNVVHAEGTEVEVHVLEPRRPPRVPVARHPLPIQHWQLPVLSAVRKQIGRRTCIARSRFKVEGLKSGVEG
jgi:hypothetical protein